MSARVPHPTTYSRFISQLPFALGFYFHSNDRHLRLQGLLPNIQGRASQPGIHCSTCIWWHRLEHRFCRMRNSWQCSWWCANPTAIRINYAHLLRRYQVGSGAAKVSMTDPHNQPFQPIRPIALAGVKGIPGPSGIRNAESGLAVSCWHRSANRHLGSRWLGPPRRLPAHP